jgi:hypothetical protein
LYRKVTIGLCCHEAELPDENGIWARKYQTSLEYGVIAVEINSNARLVARGRTRETIRTRGSVGAVLPVYDALARLKSQAHWQTDVIAGWALGTGIGYWTTTWKTPLTVRLLPGGLSVGLSKRF